MIRLSLADFLATLCNIETNLLGFFQFMGDNSFLSLFMDRGNKLCMGNNQALAGMVTLSWARHTTPKGLESTSVAMSKKNDICYFYKGMQVRSVRKRDLT